MFVLWARPNGTISASASVPDAGGVLQLVVTAVPHQTGSSYVRTKLCRLHFKLQEGDELGRSVEASCAPSEAVAVEQRLSSALKLDDEPCPDSARSANVSHHTDDRSIYNLVWWCLDQFTSAVPSLQAEEGVDMNLL